jgi:hypothetical protein
MDFRLKIVVTCKSDVESEILLEILKYYTQAQIYANHSGVISMTNEDSKVT